MKSGSVLVKSMGEMISVIITKNYYWIKIIVIYYGFSYSVTSNSYENTTSSNMSWIFMLIIWIHYFIHHIHEYLNNILNLNKS
jgi:hypothetical protein